MHSVRLIDSKKDIIYKITFFIILVVYGVISCSITKSLNDIIYLLFVSISFIKYLKLKLY